MTHPSATAFFDLPYVYAYFKRFVQLYIPNTLHTKFNPRGTTSLPYLKCSLLLAELLLHYHDKELYNHFNNPSGVSSARSGAFGVG